MKPLMARRIFLLITSVLITTRVAYVAGTEGSPLCWNSTYAACIKNPKNNWCLGMVIPDSGQWCCRSPNPSAPWQCPQCTDFQNATQCTWYELGCGWCNPGTTIGPYCTDWFVPRGYSNPNCLNVFCVNHTNRSTCLDAGRLYGDPNCFWCADSSVTSGAYCTPKQLDLQPPFEPVNPKCTVPEVCTNIQRREDCRGTGICNWCSAIGSGPYCQAANCSTKSLIKACSSCFYGSNVENWCAPLSECDPWGSCNQKEVHDCCGYFKTCSECAMATTLYPPGVSGNRKGCYWSTTLGCIGGPLSDADWVSRMHVESCPSFPNNVTSQKTTTITIVGYGFAVVTVFMRALLRRVARSEEKRKLALFLARGIRALHDIYPLTLILFPASTILNDGPVYPCGAPDPSKIAAVLPPSIDTFFGGFAIFYVCVAITSHLLQWIFPKKKKFTFLLNLLAGSLACMADLPNTLPMGHGCYQSSDVQFVMHTTFVIIFLMTAGCASLPLFLLFSVCSYLVPECVLGACVWGFWVAAGVLGSLFSGYVIKILNLHYGFHFAAPTETLTLNMPGIVLCFVAIADAVLEAWQMGFRQTFEMLITTKTSDDFPDLGYEADRAEHFIN